jgi:hypothetical protein
MKYTPIINSLLAGTIGLTSMAMYPASEQIKDGIHLKVTDGAREKNAPIFYLPHAGRTVFAQQLIDAGYHPIAIEIYNGTQNPILFDREQFTTIQINSDDIVGFGRESFIIQPIVHGLGSLIAGILVSVIPCVPGVISLRNSRDDLDLSNTAMFTSAVGLVISVLYGLESIPYNGYHAYKNNGKTDISIKQAMAVNGKQSIKPGESAYLVLVTKLEVLVPPLKLEIRDLKNAVISTFDVAI